MNWSEPRADGLIEWTLDHGMDWLGSVEGSLGLASGRSQTVSAILLRSNEDDRHLPVARVDHDTGEFRFDAVPPGTYQLRVFGVSAAEPLREVQVSSSATTRIGLIDL